MSSATLALLQGKKKADLEKELSSGTETKTVETKTAEPEAETSTEETAVSEIEKTDGKQIDLEEAIAAGTADAEQAPAATGETEVVAHDAEMTQAAEPSKKKGGKKKASTAAATAGIDGEILGVDLIVSTAHELENLDATKAQALAKTLADQSDFSDFKLGGVLSVIQTNSWFAPYETFRAFVEAEFSIGYRKAMYLIDIYRKLVESGVPWDKVKEVGWTKLTALVDVMTLDNVDDWVEKAQQHTMVQLTQMIDAAKKGEPGESDGQTVSNLATLTVKVAPEQKAVIKQAIDKAKAEMGDDTKSDGFCLEMVCLSYVNGGSVQVSGGDKPLVDVIKEKGLVDFLNELEEKLAEAFPGVVFNATVPEEYAPQE